MVHGCGRKGGVEGGGDLGICEEEYKNHRCYNTTIPSNPLPNPKFQIPNPIFLLFQIIFFFRLSFEGGNERRGSVREREKGGVWGKREEGWIDGKNIV